jgi:hypothetical protein
MVDNKEATSFRFIKEKEDLDISRTIKISKWMYLSAKFERETIRLCSLLTS